jgi:hypothetical protein
MTRYSLLVSLHVASLIVWLGSGTTLVCVAMYAQRARNRAVLELSGTEHFVGCLDLNGDGSCGPGDAREQAASPVRRGDRHDRMMAAAVNLVPGRVVLPDFTDDVATGIASYTGPTSL